MGDIQATGTAGALGFPQLHLQTRPKARVQVGGWLVEQEQVWLDRERAGKPDPLLLTARELTGLTGRELQQADPLEESMCALTCNHGLDTALPERIGDSVELVNCCIDC